MKGDSVPGVLVKVAISAGFVAFLLARIDISRLSGIFRACPAQRVVPLLAAMVIFIPLFLAVRWFVLLRGQSKGDIPPFPFVLQLTMAGLFFNTVLPTGAGGDVVRIYYATRGRERKLGTGSSVLVDRMIGSLTVLAMAGVATCLPGVARRDVAAVTGSLFALIVVAAVLLSRRDFARAFFRSFRRFLSPAFGQRLMLLYDALAGYFVRKGVLLCAVGVSFLLDLLSILCQYGLAVALSGAHAPAPGWFFAAIPLIWLSNLVPSIGGTGVREFSYVFFFKSAMGKDAAFALSLLVDLTIFGQALLGAAVFVLMRHSRQAK